MMAEMIQQALANTGIRNNQSTMVSPNGTVLQAPTKQAPTQAPTVQALIRNNTNNYLPHGQEDPALSFSDLHDEEEEEGNTGNTGKLEIMK